MVEEKCIGEIIECYLNNDDSETFVVGYVQWIDDKWILMQDILSVGRWNGSILYLQSDVVKYKRNTKYIKKMRYLLQQRNEERIQLLSIKDNVLKEILNYAKINNRVIGVELCKSGIRDVEGYVERLENNMVLIAQLDEYGKFDGKSYISCDDISRCFIDDEDSVCLEILTRKRNLK